MTEQRRNVTIRFLAGWALVIVVLLFSSNLYSVSINWGAAGNAIYDETGVGFETLERGDRVQLICDRAKDGMDPPRKDGMPGGDDELIHASTIGHGSFFEGEFSDNVMSGMVGMGDLLYVRAWNDSTLETALRWGDTSQHSPQEWLIDNPIAFTLNSTENGPWATTAYRLRIQSKRYEAMRLSLRECAGSSILEWEEGAASLRVAGPNPFKHSVAVLLSTEGRRRCLEVRLSLYDLRGALVRELYRDPCHGEDRRIAWDGTDGSGIRVRPGVYFLILEVSDGKYRGELRTKLVRAE